MTFYDYDNARRYTSNTSRSRAYDHVKYYDYDSTSGPDAYYGYGDGCDSTRPRPSRNASHRADRRTVPQWPPAPSVEDEVESLSREVASVAPSGQSEDDDAVQMRGAVDQEPIMVEVDNPDRRFVLVPPLQTSALGHNPLLTRRAPSPYAYTPTKPDAPHKHQDSSDSYLSVDTAENGYGVRSEDQKTRRKTRPDSLLSPDSAYDSGTFDDSDIDGEDLVSVRTRRRPSRYSFSSADLKKDDLRMSLHDTAVDSDQDVPASRKSGYSFTSADLKKGHFRTASHEAGAEGDEVREQVYSRQTASPVSATPPPATARSTPKSTSSSAAATPSSSSQFFAHDLPWGRPTLSRQGTFETLYGSVSSQLGGSRPSTRPHSPLVREQGLPLSPPHSPRPGSRDSITPKAFGEPRSKPPSRVASRADSPLAASLELRPPRSPLWPEPNLPERTSTFPLDAPQERSRPSSRHSRYESFKEDSRLDRPRIDVHSPSPARPPQRPVTVLPYPDDDIHQLMPAEEQYQYNHDSPVTSSASFNYEAPTTPSQAIGPSYMRDEVSSPRGYLQRTMSETSAQTNPVAGPFSSRDSRSRLDVERELPSTSHLPLCPRSIRSKYDDWYTLEGSTTLDICPDCLDGIIGRHPFRAQFFRARRNEVRKKCDFSSYWFRLAWELTLEQQRPDLSLIRNLADITHTEPECPDTRETHRIWYGMPRPYEDTPISNLYICQADVRTLETLFPTLRNFFTRLSPSSTPHLCALRPSSRRAATYLATLASTHAAAVADRKPADTTPFARLADALAWKQECQQDTLLRNAPWHTCAAIPALTVCEACYDEVVRPARAAGSRLAGTLSRSLGLALDEPKPYHSAAVAGGYEFDRYAPPPPLGHSCQLYSPRMRRAWARAVRDDDVVGFAGVVRARRKAEVRLQGRVRALKARLEELETREERRGWGRADRSDRDGWSGWVRDVWGGDGGGGGGGGAVEDVGVGMELERLRAEMAAVAREWREWE